MAKSNFQFGENTGKILALAKVDRAATPRRLEALLAAQPFFQGLSRFHLGLLAGLAMEIEFNPGQIIFKHGDPANRFYLVLEGEVMLEIETQEKRTIPVFAVGPQEDLGWSWIFASSYFHATARSVGQTRAIFFYGTILRQQCEEDHTLGYELMKCAAATAIQNVKALQRLVAQVPVTIIKDTNLLRAEGGRL